MSYRATEFAPREFYHIYNRGNSRQAIFLDGADYRRFQDLLYLANAHDPVTVRNARKSGVYEVERGEQLVAIGAYCLMPNHFHILLTPVVDDGVSIFMHKVATGYAMYFNKRHEHTGSLFEGKFKSKHASNDEYLKYLFSYIHLNPLKLTYSDWKERVAQSDKKTDQGKALVQDLLQKGQGYYFSSYQDYVHDVRNESMILSKEFFPEYFRDASAWSKEMNEWIRYSVDE